MISAAAATIISSIIALGGTGASAGASASANKKAEATTDAWNAKALEREDAQNRFGNVMAMKQSGQNQRQIDEAGKMNNASLYQDSFNKMLSTINNNSNAKNLLLQRWGGR